MARARCKEALVGPGRVFEPVEVDLDIESLGPRGLSSPSTTRGNGSWIFTKLGSS